MNGCRYKFEYRYMIKAAAVLLALALMITGCAGCNKSGSGQGADDPEKTAEGAGATLDSGLF